MKSRLAVFAALMLSAVAIHAAEPTRKYFPATATAAPPGTKPAFSAAVLAGDTLYVSGVIDMDPATSKVAATAEEGAKIALDSLKKSIEAAGMTMDDLAWVQVFCSDLSIYAKFNEVYRSYFHGELPARAFLGVDHLLANAHFEVMGIAVRKPK